MTLSITTTLERGVVITLYFIITLHDDLVCYCNVAGRYHNKLF